MYRLRQLAFKLQPAMTAFDPWTATLGEALAHPNAHESPAGALFQQITASELMLNREKFEDGSGFDVLEAVAKCAMAGLVMPDWLAKVYLKRYRAVQSCTVESWDAEQAFGRPYPKGTQISQLRRKRANRIKVISAAHRLVNSDAERPIDTAFWEEIGRAAGEGKTSAQELYAEAVRVGWAYPMKDIKSRHLRGLNPTNSRKLTGLRKRA